MSRISEHNLMRVQRSIDQRAVSYQKKLDIKKIMIILVKQRFKVKDLRDLQNEDVHDILSYIDGAILSGRG